MEARTINNKNLREAVALVAPRRPTGHPPGTHNPDHRLVYSKLCFGITNPGNVSNIG